MQCSGQKFIGYNLLMLTLKKPKVLFWTTHAHAKMRFYGLSEQRVRRIIHSPKRIQEGIAPKTIAMMQPNVVHREKGKETWKYELWVMIKEEKERRKIISAWRYPGMTKAGEPLPPEILRELKSVL